MFLYGLSLKLNPMCDFCEIVISMKLFFLILTYMLEYNFFLFSSSLTTVCEVTGSIFFFSGDLGKLKFARCSVLTQKCAFSGSQDCVKFFLVSLLEHLLLVHFGLVLLLWSEFVFYSVFKWYYGIQKIWQRKWYFDDIFHRAQLEWIITF